MSKSTALAIIIGVFVVAAILVTAAGMKRVLDPPVPTPMPTPMDVILKMRGPDGEIEVIWLCKYSRNEGWICEVREEEPSGESVD